MKGAHPDPGRRDGLGYIEALAQEELTDWFIWDTLVTAAYEHAGQDRMGAIKFLAHAICELSARDEADLPTPAVIA